MTFIEQLPLIQLLAKSNILVKANSYFPLNIVDFNLSPAFFGLVLIALSRNTLLLSDLVFWHILFALHREETSSNLEHSLARVGGNCFLVR